MPRWNAKPDRELARPPAGPTNAIDLATPTPDDYPQFLGPNRNQSIDDRVLEPDWESHPPQLVWRQPIGAGWSGFVAVNGYAVTQEQRDTEECVSCLEIATGKLIWSNGVPARHETTLGGTGPRATPAIDAGSVYAMGAKGGLRCLDGADGHERWRQKLGNDRDAEVIAWGRSGSPLIVDGLVVVPAGGIGNGMPATLIAFDKENGQKIWQGGETQISYASPTLVTLNGTRQILYVAENQVMGFDPATGNVLWKHSWPGNSAANASSTNAVPIDDHRIFLSKSYGQGSAVVEVRCVGGTQWSADEVWAEPTRMKTKFSNVVYYQGQIFGFDDTMLQCIDAETGERHWKRGRFGFGQLLRVGDKLLIAGENGELALVAATAEQFQQLGMIQAIDGKTWNNPCVYGDLVLLRNATEAACYRVAFVGK